MEELDDLDETDASERFFDFRIADIAMGSGHFLLAAVDHIAEELSAYLAERTLPGVQAELERLRSTAAEALGDQNRAQEIEDAQLLRRQIARRCIYGVDLNRTAVHLARLSLWIHTFVPGLPLSFLDHGLVQGNSILGIATLEEARDAANLVEEGQASFWDEPMRELLEEGREAVERLGRLSDADASEIREARRAQQEAEESEAPLEALFDILTAARIDEELREHLAQGAVLEWDLTQLPGSDPHHRARKVLGPLTPFHFPTRFPEVFRRDRSGFDVIVGNPPWEKAKLEENEFWARHRPGYKALSQRKQEELKEELRNARPDLARKLRKERQITDKVRETLSSKAYGGMDTGDPDLYKAFCWRFWSLARSDHGLIGVVLPQSVFNSKGTEQFRKMVYDEADVYDLTVLRNNGGWAFDDMDVRKTIGLTSIRRKSGPTSGTLSIRGPFSSRGGYESGVTETPVQFDTDDVLEWTDSAALPLLPKASSADVFAQIRNAPRLDFDDGQSWRARPYTELHTTQDKHLFDLTDAPPDDCWPVYKGESFDLWNPDTGIYYAWAEPEPVIERIQEKRDWGANRSDSPWGEFPEDYIHDIETQECFNARVVFRDVTNKTNQRTVIVALVPPDRFLVHTAPSFCWPRGDRKDQAFLLGVMASIPYDWYMRRFVETHMTYHVLNPSPIPRPKRNDPLWERTVVIAGTLATPDARFSEWANAVGVSAGSIKQDRKVDLIRELDAVVAHLYGLSASQLSHVFTTFHKGWDPSERLEETLVHFNEWKERL